ncbi:ABC transporter substrate-binding protein [Thermocoleostomius sinensis]|uniref:Thiamine pyrimidine synthase n=1 Tax=Thermocoleostomius sinensis A174 TaxID=2016057 RepID=A0A9E8ZII0_9CYAN|nr:ABC transporter substrate-binding protein [Thermocoleostomius sinensis]WAL59126.1 ABC transporter substrate-binding protein [Thermocoleostomius sinensis A174]
MKRRSLLKFSSYLGATVLLTRLGQTKPALAQSAEPDVLTMQLDWVFNVQFAGLLLAEQLGLYQDKGVNVVIKPWESGMIVPEEVVKNPLTIGCAEQNLILDAQAQGAPIKAIATMFQASPYALMMMPDSGLTTLADLAGKTVGVHVDGLKVMELVKGVNNLPTIEVVEVPYENKLDRLIQGEVAALQCYAVDEPIGFAQQVGEAPLLLPMDQYGYNAYAQTFFTTTTVLEQQPDQVSAFLEASFEGWKRALADISGTAQMVAEIYAEPDSKYTDVDYQTQSLALVGEYVMRGISEAELGVISAAQWQETAELMADYGIITAAPSVEASLDLSVWPGTL